MPSRDRRTSSRPAARLPIGPALTPLAVLIAALLALWPAIPAAALTFQTESQAPARPEVIAHRGASGYLPEHTLAAYAMAHAMGADWIEPDVVMTRDGALICSHEITLEATTDVATKFPDRYRRNGSYYAIDFTLDEIAQLNRVGRVNTGGPRLPGHRVPTLKDVLEMLKALNERTGRNVGIIPEPKDADFHRKHGTPIEPALLRRLRNYGYVSREDRAIIQSFDPWSLRAMREVVGTDLRLVYLSEKPIPDIVLEQVAGYCDGIGPNHTLLAEPRGDTWAPTDLARRARTRGLSIWPYTLPKDPLTVGRFLAAVPVDGFFTNHPDTGVLAANLIAAENEPAAAAEAREDALKRFRQAAHWIRQWTGGDAPRPSLDPTDR